MLPQIMMVVVMVHAMMDVTMHVMMHVSDMAPFMKARSCHCCASKNRRVVCREGAVEEVAEMMLVLCAVSSL